MPLIEKEKRRALDKLCEDFVKSCMDLTTVVTEDVDLSIPYTHHYVDLVFLSLVSQKVGDILIKVNETITGEDLTPVRGLHRKARDENEV